MANMSRSHVRQALKACFTTIRILTVWYCLLWWMPSSTLGTSGFGGDEGIWKSSSLYKAIEDEKVKLPESVNLPGRCVRRTDE